MRCYALMLVMLAAAPVLAEEKNEAPREVLVVQQPLMVRLAKPEGTRLTPSTDPRKVLELFRHAQGGKDKGPARLGDGNELELLSDLMANLLSGNTAKLLAENTAHLLSENEAELLSGNTLLSDNEVELLSGNEVELISGNSATFMSGNHFSLTINITESGNNSGNEEDEDEDEDNDEAASFRKLDRDHNGRVSLQEFRGKRKGKRARRARKRFVKLDRNDDGVLSVEEMGSK